MSGAAESVMKIGNNADLASTLSHTAAAKQQAKVAATPAPAAETAARSAAKAGNAGVPVTLSENVLTAALGRSAGLDPEQELERANDAFIRDAAHIPTA